MFVLFLTSTYPSYVSEVTTDLMTKNSTRYNNYTEYVGRFKSPDVVKLDIYADSITLWEVSLVTYYIVLGVYGVFSTFCNYSITIEYDLESFAPPQSYYLIPLQVSPAAIKYLKQYLSKTDKLTYNLTMRFEWSITRNPDSTTADKTVSGFRGKENTNLSRIL